MSLAYPKLTHVTLPSVEEWGTNMNILKDPPKGLYTRRVDRVGLIQNITQQIDGAGDRACEFINVYPRGVNQFQSVNYQNNGGTIGGQSPLGEGLSSNLSQRNQQSKLPYRVAMDGAFRPPVLTGQDLRPLSRLPRLWTTAATNPNFPEFASKLTNPSTTKSNKEEVIRSSIRPTAVFNINIPSEPTYEVKNVINHNPINFGITSRPEVIGITPLTPNEEPTKGILMSKEYNQISTNPKGIEEDGQINFDESLYINNDLPCYSVFSNPSSSRVTPLPGSTEVAAFRKTPAYGYTTNISDPRIENVYYNQSRNAKLPEKINKGGFQNSGTNAKYSTFRELPCLTNKSVMKKAADDSQARYTEIPIFA